MAFVRFLAGTGIFLLVAACSGGGGSIDTPSSQTPSEPGTPTPSTPPTEQGSVTSPASSIQVSASIAAITLGDDCASGKQTSGDFAGTCAAPPAPCGGGSFCQQSNVQITFNANATGQTANIEVAEVTLYDESGTELAKLTPKSPKSWNGSQYAAWDQRISPSATVKASYDLSAPPWSQLGTNSYSKQYKVRVSLRVDGATLLLESTALHREPAVAT